MRAWYIFGSGLAVLCSTALPSKPTATQKPEPAACAALHADYEDASKRMAQNHVSGIGDNSAVRATKRETENNTILAQARLTLDLLKSNGCRIPTRDPSIDRYYQSALKCESDMLDVKLSGKYSFPPSCERAKWAADPSTPRD